MQEGQDRSGDQPPEYLGAWSPIPAGDQPDRPSGDEPAAAGSQAEQDEPAAPEGTWVIPAAGDQRSGTQRLDAAGPVSQQQGLPGQGLPGQQDRPGADQPRQGLAGLGFGGQPGDAQPGYGQAGTPQGGYPQAGPDQPGYGQPGHNQPGHNQPTAAFGQPGYGPPGYGPPQYGQPQYGQPQYGQPQYGQPQYGQPGPNQPTAGFGQAAASGGYGQPGQPGEPGQAGGYGEPGQPGGYGQTGGYGQAGGYGQPGGYGGQDPWGPPPGGGSGSGWGSGDIIGYGGQGPEPPRRRRGSRALVYVVVAALAAGVGAGAVVALNHNSQSGSNVSAQQIPTPNSNAAGGANTTNLNEDSVANKVKPGMVDINSTLKYEDGAAAGTGMILSSDGVVLTNNHVVEGSTHLTATTVVAGKKYQATVIGVDPTDDVALIKLQGASGLKTVQVGDSSKVSLGTGVVAIGNAGGTGGSPTVTSGTITALGRTITASDSGSGQNTETLHNMLQTNAPIAEGDSGGALANASGQVIGMNTAANGQSLGGAGTSMGFAIPINRALSIAKKIAAGNTSGGILIGPKGFMGVGVDAVTDASACLAQSGIQPGYQVPTQSGALVCSVYQGTPAYKAGVRPGDVITGVSGQSVSTATGLTGVMLKYKPGATVSLTWVGPNKQSHTSSLTLIDGPVK
jgi:S1-C subfamily serine protease